MDGPLVWSHERATYVLGDASNVTVDLLRHDAGFTMAVASETEWRVLELDTDARIVSDTYAEKILVPHGVERLFAVPRLDLPATPLDAAPVWPGRVPAGSWGDVVVSMDGPEWVAQFTCPKNCPAYEDPSLVEVRVVPGPGYLPLHVEYRTAGAVQLSFGTDDVLLEGVASEWAPMPPSASPPVPLRPGGCGIALCDGDAPGLFSMQEGWQAIEQSPEWQVWGPQQQTLAVHGVYAVLNFITIGSLNQDLVTVWNVDWSFDLVGDSEWRYFSAQKTIDPVAVPAHADGAGDYQYVPDVPSEWELEFLSVTDLIVRALEVFPGAKVTGVSYAMQGDLGTPDPLYRYTGAVSTSEGLVNMALLDGTLLAIYPAR